MPTLKTMQGNYNNVLVTGKTATDIFIQHERGITNVKLADLQDDAAFRRWGCWPHRPKWRHHRPP